jgi:hypothetical protein
MSITVKALYQHITGDTTAHPSAIATRLKRMSK